MSKNHPVRLRDMIKNEEKQKRQNAGIGSVESFDLPEHFDKQANKHLQSVIRGRHPKSLPKTSELWHYNKLSTQRRNRINKGHTFWEVINEENSLGSSLSPGKGSPKDGSQYTVEGMFGVHPDDHTVLTEHTGNSSSHPHSNNSKPGTASTAAAASQLSINSQLKSMIGGKGGGSAMDALEMKIDFKNKSRISFGEWW